MAKHTRHGAAVALLVLAALPMAVRTAVSQEPLDPARVAEISQWLPEAPCGVGRPADDRQAWEALAASAAFHGVVAQASENVRCQAILSS